MGFWKLSFKFTFDCLHFNAYLELTFKNWNRKLGGEKKSAQTQGWNDNGSQMYMGRCLLLLKCQQEAIKFNLLVTLLHYGNLNVVTTVTWGLHYSQEYR